MHLRLLATTACALAVVACSDDGSTDASTDAGSADGSAADAHAGDSSSGGVPTTYAFTSKVGTGSSVSYSGQVHRHVLIGDLKIWVGELTQSVDGGKAYKVGDVKKALMFYYDYKGGEGGSVPIKLKTTPPLLQVNYGDIGDASLKAKIAGNDAKGQHKDFTKKLAGWAGQTSAEGLVIHWFDALDKLTVDRIAGKVGKDPAGKALAKVFVTESGLDLQQLIQKFLLGAVTFSQGADDYLDDDTDGKGLKTQNVKPDKDGKPYTTLEHQWDEGFGYFGAARDYGDYTDDEIAAKGGRDGWKSGYHDTDGDGKIDLKSEYNFGHALNCAKRDRGSKDIAATNYTKEAFDAFLVGRTIIGNAAGNELTPGEMKALLAQRDIIVSTWEKCAAATAVHYINETLGDMSKFGTADYAFYDHAKHWSELKGFALSLQFSRHSPLKAAFADVHTKIGDAPVLASADKAAIDAYKKALVDARKLIGDAYAFDAKLLGDDKGANGW